MCHGSNLFILPRCKKGKISYFSTVYKLQVIKTLSVQIFVKSFNQAIKTHRDCDVNRLGILFKYLAAWKRNNCDSLYIHYL